MKFKSALGLVAGALLILSAGAHTILGWKAMSDQLAQTNAPPDLVMGLRMGWTFGGPVMLVFGILCITTFWKRFRGVPSPTLAPVLIAISYIAFAAWAAFETGGDPFFMLFLVPGVLLAIASIP
jgi:hypothetical protein